VISQSNAVAKQPSFWKTVLLCGALYFVIMAVAAPVLDIPDFGCMFVIPAYFTILAITLAIVKTGRFWAGTAAFIPYAVLGFFPEYYFEWMTQQSLKGLWGVFAWCLIGPLVGLLGDLAYRYAPATLSPKSRAIVTGAVLGAAIFFTTLFALTTFYVQASMDSHLRYFVTGWYFSLPWLVINGGFAGYTAYAMIKK
jgi:hypothetical protein